MPKTVVIKGRSRLVSGQFIPGLPSMLVADTTKINEKKKMIVTTMDFN